MNAGDVELLVNEYMNNLDMSLPQRVWRCLGLISSRSLGRFGISAKTSTEAGLVAMAAKTLLATSAEVYKHHSANFLTLIHGLTLSQAYSPVQLVSSVSSHSSSRTI